MTSGCSCFVRSPSFAGSKAWAVVPWLFTGQDPIAGVPAEKLQGPSPAHVFGTDAIGRDLFTRVVYGAVHSLSDVPHKKPRPLLFYRGEYTGIEPDKGDAEGGTYVRIRAAIKSSCTGSW